LSQTFPEELKDWRLVLVGGSPQENPYLEKIKKYLSSGTKSNVELRINIPLSELESYYHKAMIFWHFCGLHQSDPALVEHFGMSIVEAMQYHCVPVVFDGGGQREIVEQGVSGFRFSSRKELEDRTMELLRDDNLRHKLSQGACARGMLFTREVFVARIKNLFGQIMDAYFPNRGEE
jgi:glycosyltransferase involved in cell wall biosynthesis